jgi:hypothetical protein
MWKKKRRNSDAKPGMPEKYAMVVQIVSEGEALPAALEAARMTNQQYLLERIRSDDTLKGMLATPLVKMQIATRQK